MFNIIDDDVGTENVISVLILYWVGWYVYWIYLYSYVYE